MLQRLTSEDARILALESGAVVGHTCKIVIAERACDDVVVELRRQVAARIGRAPALRLRLAPTPLRLAAPAWVDDPAFDPAAHIRRAGGGDPASREQLRELVADLMAQRLDRSRPLWQLDVTDLEDGLVAGIWRVHHALADGAASLALGEVGIWAASPTSPVPAGRPAALEPVPGPMALAVTALSEHAQNLAAAVARAAGALLSADRWREKTRELATARPTLRRELRRLDGDSPLDAVIGRRRRVAFVDLPLDDVVGAAHALGGVTVNDVALALVAGGLRQWLEHRHGEPGPMRVQVPVSMHRPGDSNANVDSFLNVDLPVAEPDPVRRVRAVSGETRDRKAHHDADELYALFTDLSHASKRLYRRAYDVASDPHVFALSVSNVRGPSEPRYLAGGRIREFYSLAEIAPRHALRVSAWSFSGRFSFGLCADADAVPDLDILASGLEQSLDELKARV